METADSRKISSLNEFLESNPELALAIHLIE
jgi:hypothetical protein